jgi:aminoglycoside 6'-N-acetyltransferase I
MPLDYTFEHLTNANISRVVDLYATVFNSEPWSDGWSNDAALERLSAFVSFPTFVGIGCFAGDRAIGLVLGWSERWTQGWHFQIKEMCVATEYQSQHLGTRLMGVMEKELVSRNIHRIYLQTAETVPAKQFYENLGFRRIPLVSMSKTLYNANVASAGISEAGA